VAVRSGAISPGIILSPGVSAASRRLRALAALSGSLTDALSPEDAAILVEQKALSALGATSAVVVTLGAFPPLLASGSDASDPAATTLHVVQQAFVEHDAMQCGFCTPGMVMSCAALVERTPECTLEDVKAAVSGHLCRCGTYPNVFKATLAAARTRATGSRKGAAR